MRFHSWLALLPLIVFSGAAAEDDTADLKLSFWDKTVNLRGALGYKDNVLLSSFKREASAFWLSALDFSLIRASLDGGPQVTVFASAEDRRYFSAPDLDKEQLFLTQGKVLQSISEHWSIGGLVQYLYADEVYDASATEQIFLALPVKSHNAQVAPIVTVDLPWKSDLELKFTGERQIFSAPLDDYWEYGPELTYTKKFGNRSTVSLAYTYDHRAYDTRRALTLLREPIEAIPLQFEQYQLEFAWNHSWDKDRHWRTRSRLLFEINEDNGTGFYDYYRYRFMQRFGYWGADWQANIEGKILHYDYLRQPIFSGSAIRQIWEYVVTFHAEKTVWKKLKVFADNEYEVVNSNFRLESYNVNTVSLGVDWEF